MRMTRVVAAALFAVASFSAFAPASADHDCEEHPDSCYDCVMAPCYPEDWPPFLLDKVDEILPV